MSKKMFDRINRKDIQLIGAVVWSHYDGKDRGEARLAAECMAEELELKNAGDLIEDALETYYGDNC